MGVDRSVEFTGIQFENPFLLSSAPPTESESNIMRAYEAGWGGVVTKTIGLHPVVNVYGAKAKFMRTTPDDANVSMKKRAGAALHSSWNWELISDKTLEWWAPRIRRIKENFPKKVLIASIMAGSGNDKELKHWQELAETAQGEGADGLELNFSCPHMDRRDMGSNIGKDQGLCSVVTEAVKEVAKVPVWCKLTPATADIVVEAAACFRGGADAIVSSNTFPSRSVMIMRLLLESAIKSRCEGAWARTLPGKERAPCFPEGHRGGPPHWACCWSPGAAAARRARKST